MAGKENGAVGFSLRLPKWAVYLLLAAWVPLAPSVAHRGIDAAAAKLGYQPMIEKEAQEGAAAGVVVALEEAFSGDAIFAPGQQGKLDGMESRIIDAVRGMFAQHFPGPPPPEDPPDSGVDAS